MTTESTFITEIRTDKGLFGGPKITSMTWDEAEKKCPPYASVVGILKHTFNIELN